MHAEDLAARDNQVIEQVKLKRLQDGTELFGGVPVDIARPRIPRRMIMGEKNAMRVEIEQALDQLALAKRDAVEISGREHLLAKETPVSIEKNGEH